MFAKMYKRLTELTNEFFISKLAITQTNVHKNNKFNYYELASETSVALESCRATKTSLKLTNVC